MNLVLDSGSVRNVEETTACSQITVFAKRNNAVRSVIDLRKSAITDITGAVNLPNTLDGSSANFNDFNDYFHL